MDKAHYIMRTETNTRENGLMANDQVMEYIHIILVINMKGNIFIIREWKQDLKHGFGKLFLNSGDVYIGEW